MTDSYKNRKNNDHYKFLNIYQSIQTTKQSVITTTCFLSVYFDQLRKTTHIWSNRRNKRSSAATLCISYLSLKCFPLTPTGQVIRTDCPSLCLYLCMEEAVRILVMAGDHAPEGVLHLHLLLFGRVGGEIKANLAWLPRPFLITLRREGHLGFEMDVSALMLLICGLVWSVLLSDARQANYKGRLVLFETCGILLQCLLLSKLSPLLDGAWLTSYFVEAARQDLVHSEEVT